MTETPGPTATPSLWTRLNLAEPVRLRLYGVLVTVVALLVGYGLLDATQAPLWLAAGAALLGVATTEATRRATVSPQTAARTARRAALNVVDDHSPNAVLDSEQLEYATRAALAASDRAGIPGAHTTLPLAA